MTTFQPPQIETIPLFIPKKYRGSIEKVEKFLHPLLEESPLIKVANKRFPTDFIQLGICPYKNPKYEYCICLKSKGHIPLDFSVIHDSNCLIQFYRKDGEIHANLFVQLKQKGNE